MAEFESKLPIPGVKNHVFEACHHVVKALRASDNNLDANLRKLLSDLESHLSTLGIVDTKVEDTGFSEIQERFKEAVKRILSWETNQSTMLEAGLSEADQFFQALHEVYTVLMGFKALPIKTNQKEKDVYNQATVALDIAMLRLEKELCDVLHQHKQHAHPEYLAVSSRGKDIVYAESFVSLDDEVVVEASSPEDDEHIAEFQNADLIDPSVLPHIKAIVNAMFACEYDRAVCEAFISVRREALNEYMFTLEMERLSCVDVLKMEWEDLSDAMRKWTRVVKTITQIYLASEKQLCEQILGNFESISSACFIEISKDTILSLLSFGEAVALRSCQPEMLERFLSMYEGSAEILLNVDNLFPDETGSFLRMGFHELSKKLADRTTATFLKFKDAIASAESSCPFPGGGIHHLTRYVMNYLKLLPEYTNTLNSLLQNINVEDSIPEKTGQDILPSTFSPMAKHLRSIISVLESSLERKAQLYADESLKFIFMMNNFHYMVQKVKGSELKHLFGDEWMRKHIARYQHKVIEETKQENFSESSTMVTYDKPLPEHPEVFINFCGADLRHGFVDHVAKALKRDGVNVYIDVDELPREDLTKLLFKRIEESRIALVIFSRRYTESRWFLNKLVKIKELVDEQKLLIIPIFYKVDQLEVTQLKGDFGIKFWNLWRIYRDSHIIKWKEALESFASSKGIYLKEHGSESENITLTVKEVLERVSLQKRENPSLFLSTEKGKITDLPTGKGEKHETYLNKCHLFGMEQRMEQLERKLKFDCKETRIIGVVGMPGIGKTALAMMLHEKWSCKFIRSVPFLGIRKKSEQYEPEWLRKTLLEVLLEGMFPEISDKTTHEFVKVELLQKKIFAVLDDVSNKKQLDFLLGDLGWIKKGSKIVITTCDKSLLKGLSHDTYVVPRLNYKESFQLFNYHAFDDQFCSHTNTFEELSRMFVEHTRGHPLTLKILGSELCGRDKPYWEKKLEILMESSTMLTQYVRRFSVDQINDHQKDVFLDIVYFFNSEDEYFVKSLLDSGDPDFNDAVSEVIDLANKFLITISDGRVEMNHLLYMFGKDLSSPERYRLWNYKNIINMPTEMEEPEANSVRGISVDMSKAAQIIPLQRMAFTNMLHLRYLKIYDSSCPRQCKAYCKLNFPDGVEFPLEEIRYLHWVKFPLEELPPDFRPENLVDLRLPYSKIERVWEGVKDTTRLKWVDLSHSSKLLDLSALSKAENLQRLNLEGCTSLDELPVEIQNMKSLVFLNLRGCICLCYLPKMNLISLKTLILSDCSNLEEFQLISESVEFLHLDGTAIKGLPLAIQNLQRLVVLNLKNCKMLECLPKCFGELKALEELILSGCSRLKNLSDVRESMKHLQSLLVDRIGAKEMPNISCLSKANDQASTDMSVEPMGPSKWPLSVHGVSSLRRLCLSGNDFVSLQPDIEKLYNLKWLDVKHCKKLRCVPMLPPRLQYFDAHGCDSLERVANPLALRIFSEHIHATFNFSNCYNLDQDAKDSIISYTRCKSQLVLDEISRYNRGLVLEVLIGTCFPGWEVPAWFIHHASGSELKLKLPPHWCDNRFTGIGLCAVIVFHGNHDQRKHVLVKCSCKFKNEDGSIIRFSCTVGGWSEPSNTSRKIESSHVFIGFTSKLDINKIAEEEKCFSTETSIKFQVTDGTEEIKGSEVLKCGFSLLYAPEERNICSGFKDL